MPNGKNVFICGIFTYVVVSAGTVIGASVAASDPQGSILQVFLHMAATPGIWHQVARLAHVVNSLHVVLSAGRVS